MKQRLGGTALLIFNLVLGKEGRGESFACQDVVVLTLWSIGQVIPCLSWRGLIVEDPAKLGE